MFPAGKRLLLENQPKQIIMKRILLIAVVCLAIFEGCGKRKTPPKTTYDNITQQEFTDILIREKSAYYKAVNAIQKQETIDSLNAQLIQFVDSTQVFKNWHGAISNIGLSDEVKDNKNYKRLTFDIWTMPDQYLKYTFHHSELIDIDSLSSHCLYNAIKSIPNNSFVYFDGRIGVLYDQQICYVGQYDISKPTYDFLVLDISSEPLTELSPAMTDLINIHSDIDRQIRKKVTQQMSESELNIYIEKYTPHIDSLLQKLTRCERHYLSRWYCYKAIASI